MCRLRLRHDLLDCRAMGEERLQRLIEGYIHSGGGGHCASQLSVIDPRVGGCPKAGRCGEGRAEMFEIQPHFPLFLLYRLGSVRTAYHGIRTWTTGWDCGAGRDGSSSDISVQSSSSIRIRRPRPDD